MSKLISLNLSAPQGFTGFRMDGASTLANPSADLIQSLIGFPTAAGKIVTRATAVRVASFLSGVKMLSSDIAKMPLVLRSTTNVNGRVRTMPAITNPLYTLLKDCPNSWQTSYQMRWFLASQLIMRGNCVCQIIRDGKGDILSLNPLNAWHLTQKWDLSTPGKPVLYWEYSDGLGNLRRFEQSEIWHTTSTNIEGNGIEGTAIITLAKEALSVLMAAEETAGRNFANGLGMGGFLVAPAESELTEVEAQNTVDRLKKDFAGSQNAGKYTILPGGLKWEKMTFNAQESQLLESRKWNAEEVIRLLGGAPLLVKLGMGQQSSTYASSSAFLDEYYNTSLLPFCISLEQTITRDLISPKDRATLYAKHDANIILRGSLRERSETYEIQIRSGQISPNETRVLEDMDTVDGLDFHCLPANTAVFDPETKEIYIPGQDLPGKEQPADGTTKPEPDTKPEPVVPDKAKSATARLGVIANNLAERIIRKQTKGTITAEFVADVLACSTEQAEAYVTNYKTMSESEARAELVVIVTNADVNRDARGRFAPGSDAHAVLKTPAVHDGLKTLYSKASDSYAGANKQEHSFTIDKNGNPSDITTSHDESKNTVTVHKEDGKVTDQAIVHTHPKGDDPHPSSADVQIAQKTGIPNYELSRDQLWVANPDGSTRKVADVEWKDGDLNIKWKA